MNHFLANKNILLGITGSIAAYKSAELARRLRDVGANVRVVMTENAKKFITPLTMQAVSANPVHDQLFDLEAEAAMGHIQLARWADAIIIAPASANFIADLAHGNANNLLTTLCLATNAPIAVTPAMNQLMWQHSLTQANIEILKKHNISIFEPASGSQACGDLGPGRMLEPHEIIAKIATIFCSKELVSCHVVITAGPTQEPIDPVRYLSNYSSGKMGYALAEAANAAGANVTLISGPVNLKASANINTINVTTALEMQAAVLNNKCDIFIGVAAVCDYRPQRSAEHKIPKNELNKVALELNPDIVKAVAALKPKPFVVGFAAETENVIANAQAKRAAKNLDVIIANRVGKAIAMGTDDNEVTFISHAQQTTIANAAKSQIAFQLIQLIAKEYKNAISSNQYGCAS